MSKNTPFEEKFLTDPETFEDYELLDSDEEIEDDFLNNDEIEEYDDPIRMCEVPINEDRYDR